MAAVGRAWHDFVVVGKVVMVLCTYLPTVGLCATLGRVQGLSCPQHSRPRALCSLQATLCRARPMFVPRALRLKGVQEPQRPRTAKAAPDLTPPPLQTDTKHGSRGPIFTTKPVTPDYVAQLAAGIELIFSDYAHQEVVRSEWLQARYRRVDGEDKCT